MTTSRRPRGALAVALVAAALLLAACAGVPLSGPVRAGLPADDSAGSPDFSFLSEKPRPGATPVEIVQGFVRAAAVPADGWNAARQYLTPAFQATWRPDAGVTVDALAQRTYDDSAPGTVTLRTSAEATVDSIGAYSGIRGGASTLGFQLVSVDGQWRIDAGPDGVLLDSDLFPRVYRAYDLMYFEPAFRYLVPDVRWFPTPNAPTRIVDALVNGRPVPWLAASVRSAFPEGIAARPSVPIVDGVAQVELDEAALRLDSTQLGRMKTQLDESLASAGVGEARMTVAGSPLVASPAPVRSTTVDARPLVQTAAGFGYLSGDDLEPIPGLSDAILRSSPAAVQVGADADAAAVRREDGVVVRISADGAVQEVDARPGTLDPSIGPSGGVWSAARDDPGHLVSVLASGTRIDIHDAWPGASSLQAMRASRDGARLAAVVVSGGRVQLWTAGVVRDAAGQPSGVGAPDIVADLPGAAIGLAWADERSVAVVTHGPVGNVLTVQTIGGEGTTALAPANAVSVAASSASAVRVLAPDGVLSVRRGVNWQDVDDGVRLLATVQGIPVR